jgi:hypothetical protein
MSARRDPSAFSRSGTTDDIAIDGLIDREYRAGGIRKRSLCSGIRRHRRDRKLIGTANADGLSDPDVAP